MKEICQSLIYISVSKGFLFLVLICGHEHSGEAYFLPAKDLEPINIPKTFAPRFGTSLLKKSPTGRIRRFMKQKQGSQVTNDEDNEGNLRTLQNKKPSKPYKIRGNNGGVAYDSLLKFKPNDFAENSPEWNLAMIQYLLDMKKNGHKIREIESSKSLADIYKSLDEGQDLMSKEPKYEDNIELIMLDKEKINESSLESGNKTGPIVCKMEPFNLCYRVNSKGMMHALGDRRPVRLLRVYKK